jgi:inner membrane protein
MGALMDGVTLEFWHWFVIALLLGIIEMAVPGAAFLWLGLAAALVGLLLTLVDLGSAAQFGSFALLSVLLVGATRLLPKPVMADSDQPLLNQRGARLIGQQLILDGPLTGGRGQAQVGDSLWTVTGIDLPAGTRVRVTGIDGATLRVEKVG